MFYREAAPSAELSDIVLSFWEFSVSENAPEPIIHEVFPDGCISLFYYRNLSLGINEISIAGLIVESIFVQVLPGDVYWGVRINPAAASAVLRLDPAEIRTQPMRFFSVLKCFASQLIEKLNICEDFTAANNIFESFIKKLPVENVDTIIAAAVRFIENNQGQSKVSEIAEFVELSPRQFERRFRRASGLTPKQYIRTRRLRATTLNWLENSAANWANLAAEMGFADQAHLTHEFAALTKRSPVSFVEKVNRIEHGTLVK